MLSSGSITGHGHPGRPGASESDLSMIRRERLKKLAMETIDLRKDPYLARTQMGTLECRLCGTTHSTEGSYLAHSQGRRHQVGLAKRLEQLKPSIVSHTQAPHSPVNRSFVKIGVPVSRLVGISRDERNLGGFAISVQVPEIAANVEPQLRIMSAYEQRVEPLQPQWQYVLVAAEPYETVAFRVPNRPLALDWQHFDPHIRTFTAQFFFK